jgi:hypothetical protein
MFGKKIISRIALTPSVISDLLATNTPSEYGKNINAIKYEKDKIIGFSLESKIHNLEVSYMLEETEKKTKFFIEANIRWKFPMNIFSIFVIGVFDGVAKLIVQELIQENLCDNLVLIAIIAHSVCLASSL